MAERAFSNIINLTVGSNTALEAVNVIITQLKTLQGVAYETGLSLQTNVMNKMGGQGARPEWLTKAVQEAELSATRAYGQTTMGGLAAQGSGGISIPADAYRGTAYRGLQEEQAPGMNPMVAAQMAKAIGGQSEKNFEEALRIYNGEVPAATKQIGITRRMGEFPFKREPEYMGAQDTEAYRFEGERQLAQIEQSTKRAMRDTGKKITDWEDPAQIQKTADALNNVDQAAQKSGRSFSSHVGSIITGMLVWQGMNTVMNAVIGTYQTAVDETMRLDQASARLSVTLGTTKEAASQTAMAMSLQGVQYGLAPEQSLKAGQWAARMEKTPESRGEIQKVAQTLAAISPEGEDVVKIMQALHGASVQTGLSFDVLGDRAAIMTQKANVSITEYLSNLAQLGPLAEQNGVDLEKLGIIAAMTADRTGESMSQVTNTATRLMRASQAPNQEQLSIMGKYGIKVGDYDEMMSIIAKAKMTTEEIGQMSGMPGKPEVTQQVLAFVETYKLYNDTMKQGMGMQEQLAKSTDNAAFAQQRLSSAWKVFSSEIMGSKGVLDFYKNLADVIETAAKAAEYAGKQGTTNRIGVAGGVYPANWQQQAYQGGMYQAGMQGQNMPAELNAPAAITAPKQTMTAMQLMLAQAAEKETGPIDLNKYNQAQITAARADAQRMSDDWLKSLSDFYDSQKIPEDEKEKSMAKAKEMIDSTVAFFEKNGQIISETGAPARYLQEALSKREQETSGLKTTATDVTRYSDEDLKRGFALVPQYVRNLQDMWRQQLANEGRTGPEIARIIGEKMTEMNQYQAAFMRGNSMTMLQGPAAMLLPQILPQLSRTQALEDRLSELRMSLEDLDDTEKKRAQLEGQWNIPTGAKLLVPLTSESQALIKEHGGESEDEAKNRRREQILREIAETERKLAAEKAKDATLLAMLSAQQNASSTANMGLSSTGAAGQQAAIALYALKAAAGDWGSRPGPTAAEQARERVGGATPPSEPPWREPGERNERVQAMASAPEAVPTGTYQQGMQGQSMNLNSTITLKAFPINIVNTTMLTMDGVAVAQALQKYFTTDLVYEAASSGALSQ